VLAEALEISEHEQLPGTRRFQYQLQTTHNLGSIMLCVRQATTVRA
jgi:hypothetical protein